MCKSFYFLQFFLVSFSKENLPVSTVLSKLAKSSERKTFECLKWPGKHLNVCNERKTFECLQWPGKHLNVWNEHKTFECLQWT